MEILINHITKRPSGYGHYDITLHTESGEIKHVTSNMPLIDSMNSDDQDESDEAARVAVEMVLNKNGYNVESVISECGACGACYVAKIEEEK